MAASGEHDPLEPLSPLPSWQLFANVETQSELLDDVSQQVASVSGTVAEVAVDPFAVAAVAEETVDSVASDEVASTEPRAVTERPAAPAIPATQEGISLPVETAAAGSRTVTAPLIELGRAIRRSIFVPPLPTLRDVVSGVEPAVREISPIGTDYTPGSLGRVVGA